MTSISLLSAMFQFARIKPQYLDIVTIQSKYRCPVKIDDENHTYASCACFSKAKEIFIPLKFQLYLFKWYVCSQFFIGTMTKSANKKIQRVKYLFFPREIGTWTKLEHCLNIVVLCQQIKTLGTKMKRKTYFRVKHLK